jgi:hypothetical protein
MQKANTLSMIVAALLAAFLIGRWTAPSPVVRADTGASPIIALHPISGGTSLTVFYPNLNKLYVYQNPFVGLPTWSCSYSIQLSTPGGTIERQPCPNPGQQF